jgi:hypothetical protein
MEKQKMFQTTNQLRIIKQRWGHNDQPLYGDMIGISFGDLMASHLLGGVNHQVGTSKDGH